MVKMHIIAGDHLEHERPGELVEDGIRVVVRGGGHVAQTCFRIFSEQIAARVVRTAVPVNRVFYLFLTQSLARHQLHVIFWININYFQSFYHHLAIGDYDCYYWLKRPQHNSSLRLTWAWACSSSCQAPSPDCQTLHCCSWRGSKDLQAWPYACVNKDLTTVSRRESYLLGVAKYSDCPPPLFLGVWELGARSFIPRSKDFEGESTCW